MPPVERTSRATNKYNYDSPTEGEALQSLTKLLDQSEAERIWKEACASFGVPRPGSELTLDQLLQAAEWLKQQSGLTKIAGNSLSVRLRSYQSIQGS